MRELMIDELEHVSGGGGYCAPQPEPVCKPEPKKCDDKKDYKWDHKRWHHGHDKKREEIVCKQPEPKPIYCKPVPQPC